MDAEKKLTKITKLSGLRLFFAKFRELPVLEVYANDNTYHNLIGNAVELHSGSL